MMSTAITLPTLLTVLLLGAVREPVPVSLPKDPDPAYTQVIQGRAQKIVDTLGIDDETKAQQVRNLITDQYRSLSTLHDTRDAQIKAVKSQAGDNPDAAKLATKALEDMAQSLQKQLHTQYLLKLYALLTPKQVDQVKDGMTYGVRQVTYNQYLVMLPDLAEEQKAKIMALLIEARENAMDGGSSQEKHQWFRKYKGKINNYLSKAGYDLKKAEQDLKQRQKAASTEKRQQSQKTETK